MRRVSPFRKAVRRSPSPKPNTTLVRSGVYVNSTLNGAPGAASTVFTAFALTIDEEFHIGRAVFPGRRLPVAGEGDRGLTG